MLFILSNKDTFFLLISPAAAICGFLSSRLGENDWKKEVMYGWADQR